jgi:hypothetical protein
MIFLQISGLGPSIPEIPVGGVVGLAIIFIGLLVIIGAVVSEIIERARR